MPIHDWTRVDDCLFHDFHLSWVVELCKRMNHGVLPSSHFAMSETLELRPPLGFVVLPEPESAGASPGSEMASQPANGRREHGSRQSGTGSNTPVVS